MKTYVDKQDTNDSDINVIPVRETKTGTVIKYISRDTYEKSVNNINVVDWEKL